MGIDLRLTTIYHPQANGLDEHFNQTLKNAIVKYSHDHRDEWDVNLGELVYTYDTSFQESTKHSPFEAMFGRVTRVPVDCNTDNVDADRKLEEYTNLRSPDTEERDAKRRTTTASTIDRRQRSIIISTTRTDSEDITAGSWSSNQDEKRRTFH